MEITPENKGKSSMDVLTTLHRRPTSEEALSLEDRHILDSASNLGLPVDLGTMKTISLIHEKALPLIEDLVSHNVILVLILAQR